MAAANRIALGALAWLAIALGGAAAADPRPAGFDHLLHDRNIAISGGEAVACVRCHPMTGGILVGKPDHAACFGSCHGAPPRPGERLLYPPRRPAAAPRAPAEPGLSIDRLAICTSCHSEAALGPNGSGTVAYPPYTIDPDFAISVGHRRHRGVACAQCHTDKPAPHRRCAGCHDGSGTAGRGPAMTACTGCHAPAVGAALPPSIIHAEINVGGAFSHNRHAARGTAGARCTTCHAALLDIDDNILPAPAASTCAAAHCHDGTAAFAITTKCTRCHLDPKQPSFKVERPAARYSHAGHASHNQGEQPCSTCHPLTRSGEVLTVGHAPCASCHADDFGRRQPTICGACHNGTEPWRPLVADRGPPERTEFGATLDHRKHPGACTTCHALTTATTQLRPPRGHRACTGAACHAVATGPAPQLTACLACHLTGRAAARERARLSAAWSVRAAFDHAGHASHRGGEALACTGCHTDLTADDASALATPPKSTCAPCHDGATAFKLTGTTCLRCHRSS